MATGQFLAISDIHFDPFAGLGSAAVADLATRPAAQWGAILDAKLKAQPLATPLARKWSDSNYHLLIAALKQAALAVPSPDFILYPGDFLAHNWQHSYGAANIVSDVKLYEAFTKTAVQVVADEIKAVFPSTPAFATIGNDDSYCEDYWIQSDGHFLSDFASVWAPMLHGQGSATFAADFASLGCYTADLPHLPDHRLISINNLFWSNSYCSPNHTPAAKEVCGCQDLGDTPGLAVLAWVKQALDDAAAANKTVWLLMHIPMGLDSHHEGTGMHTVVHQWKPSFQDAFQSMIDASASSIQHSFNGHTHMDDYRFGTQNGQTLMHKVIPAVSPIFGNAPAVQVYDYDRADGAVTGWTTNYLTDFNADYESAPWATYDSAIYVTPDQLRNDLAATVADADSKTATAYRQHYKTDRSILTGEAFPYYACVALHTDPAGVQSCVRAARPTGQVGEVHDAEALRRLEGSSEVASTT